MKNALLKKRFCAVKILFLLAFLFTSCSFFNHNAKDDNDSEAVIETGSSYITVSGRIQEDAFFTGQERTAIPGNNTSNTATYSYTVTAQSKSSGEKYNCTVSGTGFTVSLKPGNYVFSAFGVQTGNDPSGNPNTAETPGAKKLSGSISVTVNASGTTSPSSITITVKPLTNTFGTGTASLQINVDNGNISPIEKRIQSARAYWTVNGTRYCQKFTFSSTETTGTFSFTPYDSSPATPMQMPSGSHTVQFYFSNLSDSANFMNHVCYYFSEIVNIYDGFTTNSWVDSGTADYLVTTGTGESATTSVLITLECLETFERRNFFVSADGSDNITGEVRGTLGKPFATIRAAINAIHSINDSEIFTINLLSNITLNTSDDMEDFDPDNGDMKVIIQSFGFDDAPYYIDFNELSGFNLLTASNPSDPDTDYMVYLLLKDLEIKNIHSDDGIASDTDNTYFGGYLIIQDNKDFEGTNTCNVKIPGTNKVKISHTTTPATSPFGSVPLDSRSQIGVTIDNSNLTSPQIITDGYAASLTTAAPTVIFTSDEGYSVGWSEETSTYHTEAVVAVTSGAYTPVEVGRKSFDIVFPEYAWINTDSNATSNTSLNIKFRYDGKELTADGASGTGNVNDLKAYQIKVTKFSPTSNIDKIIKDRSGTFASSDYSTSGTTGISISRSVLQSEGINNGVFNVVVRAVYKGIIYEASQFYYIGKGEPLKYFIARKKQAFEADSSASPAPEETDTIFMIATKNEFETFRDMINGEWKPSWLGASAEAVPSSAFSERTWYLINDLDLNKQDWKSIGKNADNAFDGAFDGNNYTIKGLRLPVGATGDDIQNYCGLFGYFKGALKNLNVEGIATALVSGTETEQSCASQFVGGIVAYMAQPSDSAPTSMGNIINCSYSGNLNLQSFIEKADRIDTAKPVCIGGIVGYAYVAESSADRIKDCTNNAEIMITTKAVTSSTTYSDVCIGGICGYAGCRIKQCRNYGFIAKYINTDSTDQYPECYVGGIAGMNAVGAVISNCDNFGSLQQGNSTYPSSNAYLGGIIARTVSYITDCNNYAKIDNSYAKNTSVPVAGIVASVYPNNSSSITISGCKNYGEIISKCNTIGGIVASASSSYDSTVHVIQNCINEGKITGGARLNGSYSFFSNSAGGIAGSVTNGVIKDCINNGDLNFVSTNTSSTIFTKTAGVGGIVGTISNYVKGIVSCENNGTIYGMWNIGGIAGLSLINEEDAVYTFIDCKNNGKIFAQGNSSVPQELTAYNDYTRDYSNAGGIVGKISGEGNILYNCINTGVIESVDSFYNVGGLIGSAANKTSVWNCTNTGAISYQNTVYTDYKKDCVANLLCDGSSGTTDTEIKNCFYQDNILIKASGDLPNGWTKLNSSSDAVVYSPDIYESIATFVQDYTIEDSELKYRTITLIDYAEGFVGNIASYLNDYINDNNTTIIVDLISYPVKKWQHTNDGQLDFITDGSVGKSAKRSLFVLCEHGSFTRTVVSINVSNNYPVTLTKDYYICNHEVTQAEYQAIMGSNPSVFKNTPADGEIQANRPVEKVSWFDAIVYCNKRSIAAGFTPCYSVDSPENTNPDSWLNTSSTTYTPHSGQTIQGTVSCNFEANGYRLPTEAEWEFAARGRKENQDNTYSGSNIVDDVAWYGNNSGDDGGSTNRKTHEVMKKTANELGIYDMSGNVYEWCWDWNGNYADLSEVDPSGSSSGDFRSSRGGSWDGSVSGCGTDYRYQYSPGQSSNYIGFRVVRTAQ